MGFHIPAPRAVWFGVDQTRRSLLGRQRSELQRHLQPLAAASLCIQKGWLMILSATRELARLTWHDIWLQQLVTFSANSP